MARDVVAPSALPAIDNRGRELRHAALQTMGDTGEIDLRGFARTVYRRKLMLLLIMVVGLSATGFWIVRATPHYSADALIAIQNRPSSIVVVDDTMPALNSDAATVNTEVAILKSRGLAAKVIDDLDLATDPEFAPGDVSEEDLLDKLHVRDILETVSSALGYPEFFPPRGGTVSVVTPGSAAGAAEADNPAALDEESRRRAALLESFAGRLTVEPEGTSRLIQISFISTDAAKAAMITNTLVDVYIESQLAAKTEGARRAAEWLEQRLAELGETVRSLEIGVQEQRTQSGLAENNGVNIVAQRLNQLNADLVAAQAAAAETGARYQQVRAVLKSGGNVEALPEVIASPTIQSLRAQRTQLTAGISELSTRYGDQHRSIISARAELAEVEQRLHREIDNILTGLRNEVETARMHEAALKSELEAAGKEVVRLNRAEAAIAQTARRLQANRDLYGNLLKRYTEAVALRDNQQPDARIISPAQVPLRPSYPNVTRTLALSSVGSASFAFFVLFVVERFRQRLDAIEDVERHLGLQVIGTIPDLPRLRRLVDAPGDYIQREPLSEFGSAFQRLRALLTLGNGRTMPRVILVTSALADEGKTTVTVCLGIASVSSGQKVLIIDCDFGRPKVHKMVAVKNDQGLTDILKGTATIEEAITTTAGSNLAILTIGHSRRGVIDLLNSGRMEGLLDELKESYDLIILDSTPILEVSDALILGGLADKTILVTRREWTTHRKASYAAKQLQLYGANIAGVVFNRAGVASNYPG